MSKYSKLIKDVQSIDQALEFPACRDSSAVVRCKWQRSKNSLNLNGVVFQDHASCYVDRISRENMTSMALKLMRHEVKLIVPSSINPRKTSNYMETCAKKTMHCISLL